MPVRTAMLVLGALAASLSGVTGQPESLQRLLAADAAAFSGRAGIWAKHLTTGEEAAVRADEPFNSASVIKLPVLVMAYQMADRSELSLDERVMIRKEDIRGGSGVFRYHDVGLQPTWRDVLMEMVITSDNTATDLAIAKVGGVGRVNAWLTDAGYGDGLHLVQTAGDLFAKYAALPENADRNEKTNADHAFWLGEITPRATGRLIEAIEKKTIASAVSCEAMLRMMRAQLAGQRRLNHFISLPVAHKTGDFSPVIANDVGVIYTRSGPVVVAFLGNAIRGNYGEAEDQIGRFAQHLVDYFDK